MKTAGVYELLGQPSYIALSTPSVIRHHHGSSGGWMVKLLVCGVRSPGFEPGSRHFDFRDWYLLLSSPDMSEINSVKAT